jgi:hypothetical protein
MDGTQIAAGILIIIGAGLALGLLRKIGKAVAWITETLAEAVAVKLVVAINGQLGLQEIRDDIVAIKDHVGIERLDNDD